MVAANESLVNIIPISKQASNQNYKVPINSVKNLDFRFRN